MQQEVAPLLDPETAKTVIPGLFALGGAVVGVLGGWLTAKVNQEGQRKIAQDKDRRERRRAEVEPILDHSRTRATQYLIICVARDAADSGALRRSFLELEPAAGTSSAWLVALGGEFAEVYAVYESLDMECFRQALAMRETLNEVEPTAATLRRLASNMVQVAAALRLTAEAYIEGGDDSGAVRRERRKLVEEVRAIYRQLPTTASAPSSNEPKPPPA
jgi:hypothetical protein